MAEDTEVSVDNTKNIEDAVSESAHEDDKKSRIQNAEPSMLEDETMPTYLSITSITSAKQDDSKLQPENPSPRSIAQDDKSVYDVSSGEETDRQLSDHDQDDGDYPESDDSGLNDARHIRFQQVTYEDESDDDDHEDDDDDDETEVEEDMDDDMEPEQFERSSDDYVLKSSSSGLIKEYKERSRSLQDLSSPGKKPTNTNRRFILPHNPYETIMIKGHAQFASFCGYKRTTLPPIKYNSISSKFKKHIQDIKEQNRNVEQRKINSVDKVADNYIEKESEQDENSSKVNQQRRLTSYAEYTIKNMDITASPQRPEAPMTNNVLENGINMTNVMNPKNNFDVQQDAQMEVEADDEQRNDLDYNKQADKLNGTSEHKDDLQETVIYKENDEPEDMTNGEPMKIENLDRFQTKLIRSDINNQQVEEVNTDPLEYMEESEVLIKPVNISSILEDSQKMVIDEAMEELKRRAAEVEQHNLQIISLQTQLNDREEVCEKLGKEYQKVVEDNMDLKKELEALKIMLEKISEEKNAKKYQETGVQTEEQPKTMGHTSTMTQLQPPLNKISMSSIGSTMSSIEQWTASDYSPVVSMNPPTIGNLLNSDESTAVNTPKNNTTNRAMLTTTRIIQALASMTPVKAEERTADIQGQLKDPNSPLIAKETNSRKRKASESFGAAACGPKPFKIPFININDHRKFNSDADAAAKSSGAASLAQNDSNGGQDKKAGGQDENDDDVKCIVWHEDERTKQRSCLIQASIAEDAKASGQVRNCGPYLLGNVEVRISEANGTLNIWGKELNSVADSLEEDLTEKMNNTENIWSNTPTEKVDNNFQCPSSKKSKSSSVKASICRHLRSIINRTPSPVHHSMEEDTEDTPNCRHHNQCGNCSCGPDEKCHQKSHLHSSCHFHLNNLNSPDRQFCCLHKGEECVGECGFKKDEITDNIHYLYDMTRKIIGRDSNFPGHQNCKNINNSSSSSSNNNQIYSCCKSHTPRENPKSRCRSTSLHRCSFNSETEDDVRDFKRSRHHSPEVTNRNQDCRQDIRNNGNNMHMCGANCTDDDDDFISPRFAEVAGVKKNRYRGKRVRGIMEFLKGCGDCRNPHTTSFDSSYIPETISTNARSTPSIRNNSASHSSSFQKQSHNVSYKKCCDCKKHLRLPIEIEAELEEFRIAITNLNSKSDALREMLSRVLNTD